MSQNSGGTDVSDENMEIVTLPEPPIDLKIVDMDATSVQLKWKKPTVPMQYQKVTSYQVEFRSSQLWNLDNVEEWLKGPKMKGDSKYYSATIDNLETGKKYQFRVKAQNQSGSSVPSEATFPQIVKSCKVAPKIDRKNLPHCLDQLICKVNHQLALEVEVAGEPTPTTNWCFNNQEVKSSNCFKVVHIPHKTKLIFTPCTRSHRGKYTLKATNQFGQDTIDIMLNVIGAPEMPKGPLLVENVTKKTCQLSWNVPSDDGGHEILNYEIEKRDLSSDKGFTPCGTTKKLTFQIKNLVGGKCYFFLVRAVNQNGDSPALISSDETCAKDMYEKPSPPLNPKVIDWGPSFAKITWKMPLDDGGARINHYIIETRNKSRRGWLQSESANEDCQIMIQDKIEADNEYEFRVFAVNIAGISECSVTTGSITARNRFIRPKINRELISSKTICVFKSLLLQIEFMAEPQPCVKWTYPNGSDCTHCSNCSISVNNGSSTLLLKSMERSDSGNFRVNVSNSQGTDEVDIHVNVIGCAGKPIGPLEISNVTFQSCQLHWMKPKDDGGTPIKMYSVEQNDLDKDVWVLSGKLLGKHLNFMKHIEFNVENLNEGGVYMFRVSAINSQGESAALTSQFPMCAKSSMDIPQSPSQVLLIDWDCKWVKLQWTQMNIDSVSYFIIEMQESILVPEDDTCKDNETENNVAVDKVQNKLLECPYRLKKQLFVTEWIKCLVTEDNITEAKVINLSENNKYKFRVKAVNNGGQSEPSGETDEIVCKPRMQKPLIQTDIKDNKVIVSKGDNIQLNAKIQGQPKPKTKWFYDKIEIRPSSTINIIETEKQCKLILFGARRGDTGSYTLKASNQHGKDEILLNVVVQSSPSKPRGPLKIFDVHETGCSCEWNKPDDDGDSFITHYLVEKLSGSQWITCGRSTLLQCVINGLKPHKEFRLRVKAVNEKGVSEPLESSDSVVAENSFGTPSAPPSKPVIINANMDHIDLKWDQPKNDGGSRINGYQVEYRHWNKYDWVVACEIKTPLERCEITDVKIGESYAVRVRAHNDAGYGKWSQESDKIFCKHKALKPTVIIRNSDDICIASGESLCVVADIYGEPPATDIIWSLENKDLTTGNLNSNVIMDNSKEYLSLLHINKICRRSHCGKLRCQASNQSGEAFAEVNITVFDKPSPVVGFVLVSNVTNDGCHLKWEPSQDDGGGELEYIVEKLSLITGIWVKIGSTKLNEIDVTEMEEGKEYEFRVKAHNQYGTSESTASSKRIIAQDQFTPPFPPRVPVITDWSESSIKLKWEKPLDDGNTEVTSYHIEARCRNFGFDGKEWQLFEIVEGNQCCASLNNMINGMEYQFRITAINKAGKSQPSRPSQWKQTKAQNLCPCINLQDGVTKWSKVAGERFKIEVNIAGEPKPEVTWYFTHNAAEDGQTVEIENLQNPNPNNIIITSQKTKLVINNTTSDNAGTYHVEAINRNGKDLVKFQLNVLDRPSPPEAPLLFENDSSVLSLMWKYPKNNGGSSIDHYQIEKLSSDNNYIGWMACGKSKVNTFDVCGLKIGAEYRFRVTAVNKYGFSDPLEMAHPIIIEY